MPKKCDLYQRQYFYENLNLCIDIEYMSPAQDFI